MGKKGREFDILKNFRGVVKPGEMVLVLGRYVPMRSSSKHS
jgi:ATP-binding cassette subfamily G (WHITE) protein 2 (SNQ2)